MKYWVYINKYLKGNLSREDSIRFERDLQIYCELQSEFEIVQEILELAQEQSEELKEVFPNNPYGEENMGVLDAIYGINSNTGEILPVEYDLMSDIPKLAARYSVSRRSRKFGKRFMAAAAIALLIIATAFIPQAVSTFCANDSLFEKYHHIYSFSVTRSQQGSETINLDRYEIIRSFNLSDYAAVANYAESFNNLESIDSDIVFSIGVSYLMMGSYLRAIEHFELIDNNSLYYYPALWEMALTYLKSGQTEKAIEIMNRLRKLDSIYEKNIRKIIRCIKLGNIASLFTIKRKDIS